MSVFFKIMKGFYIQFKSDTVLNYTASNELVNWTVNNNFPINNGNGCTYDGIWESKLSIQQGMGGKENQSLTTKTSAGGVWAHNTITQYTFIRKIVVVLMFKNCSPPTQIAVDTFFLLNTFASNSG